MIRAVSLPKVSLNKIDTQETYEVNLFKRYAYFIETKIQELCAGLWLWKNYSTLELFHKIFHDSKDFE